MRVELLFPSKYLKEADLQGKQVTLVIVKVQVDELTMVGGRHEKKPVVYFDKTDKMLVLNKTNAIAIAKLWGNDTDQWKGKRITLRPAQDKFQGKMVPCIRIAETKDDCPEPGSKG